jgi:hypothetical protein
MAITGIVVMALTEGETVSEEVKLGASYHEAGHAVASIILGRGVRSVSIVGDGESAGRVINHLRGAKWIDRLEEADYASSWGGFIDGRTRRMVEVEVMILLAGGLVQMKALGVEHHEVGMGLELLDEEESAAMVSKYGGEQSEWQHMVTGGDYEQAMDLVLKVSGGEGEASAYLGWLEQRTRNLIRSPGFWSSVEAVAHALEQKGELSGQRAREIVQEDHAAVRVINRAIEIQ